MTISSNHIDIPWNYSPHVLSGAVAKTGSGRRSFNYKPSTELIPWYTLCVLESGRIKVHLVANEEVTFRAPCAMLLQPYSYYSFSAPIQSEFTWVEWGISAMRRRERSSAPGEGGLAYHKPAVQPGTEEYLGISIPLKLPDLIYDRSLSTCKMINGLWWRKGIYLLRANHLMAGWLLDLIETIHDPAQNIEPNTSTQSKRIEQLIQIAELNYAQQFTTKVWAELAGISRSTLNTIMQEAYGQSAGEVLDSIKLRNACHFLKSELNITQAAKASGFRSRTAFATWFKKRTTMTPSQWVESQ